MATNPITSESLTVDFKSLMKIPVGDRTRAASISPDFLQSILSALTPIQIANAFPDYFRRQLPDVSNFVTSNILARNGGNWNQTGGGDNGSASPYYDGETKIGGVRPAGSEISVADMKKKLLEKGIDVDGIYTAVGQNGISEDDPSMKSVKGMTDDKLAEAGLQRITKPDGSTIIIQKLSEVSAMSDQEISDKISGKYVAKDEATDKQKAVLDFANRWNISPQAAAGVLNIESMGVQSDISGGAGGNYHGVFQLETAQIAGLTEKAGFGSLTPEQYRKLSIEQQLKVMDEYYKQHGITPEFFTGDPNTDASKMWALQLAPGNAKTIDYTDPNAVISRTDQASTIEAQNNLVTVGSSGAGTLPGGQQFLGDSYERIEGNATPEQISKARVELAKQEQQRRQDALVKGLYNQASPTSSEYIPDNSGRKFTVIKGNIDEVDPRLQDVISASSADLPPGYTVKAISGKDVRTTGTKNHPAGIAMDVQIYDPDGKLVPHNSNSAGWKYYEMLYRSAHIRGEEMYPDQKFIWGGAWISDAAGRGDPMHYQIVNPDVKGSSQSSGAYSFENGLDPSHPFAAEGGQLSPEERAAFDAGIKDKIKKEKEEAKKKQEEEERAAAAPPSAVNPPAPEVAPTEQQAAAPTPPPETTVAAASPETPVPQFALGGNIYGPNEDITLVNNATGQPIAQVGQNEKIEKTGNAIQVTPETKLKADELMNKYDSSSDMEERIASVEDNIQNQQNQPVTNQMAQKARTPEKAQTETPHMWRESVAAAERPVSPSFNRAMARSKFFGEGHHFTRSAPGSQS